tara:strand:+ start:1282 stop:2988 length:1707 start_codon:yes stop_codon:yes gene_type:complete
MQIVRAHLKTENNQTVKVIVFDTRSGAILQVKELDVSPNSIDALPAATAFLKTNYKKFQLTTELVADSPIIESGAEPSPSGPQVLESDAVAGNVTTGYDGRPLLQGKTVTEVEPVPDLELTLFSGEPEDQTETRLLGVGLDAPMDVPKVVEQKEVELNSLPDFPDVLAGKTQAEINQELSNYGNLLKGGMLVAGSDFELDVEGSATPPEISDDEVELQVVNSETDEANDDVSDSEISNEEERTASQPQPKRKRAVQTEGLSPEQKVSQASDRSNRFKGVGGDHILEPIPGLIQTKTEKVLSNRYNSWIVLGRDRSDPTKATRASGYGGIGHTQCASIDIVAGRMSPRPKSVKKDGEKMDIDPIFNFTPDEDNNPVCDAARIYISQKTDVDKNFKLKAGKVGMAVARSAIAMKADGIRILAREGIKLVTRADRMNSQGGPLDRIFGVDIIAGNDDKSLQPMVLGNNLVLSMEEMAQILSEVIGTVNDIVINMSKLDLALSTHIHPSPFFGAPTLPSPGMAVEAVASMAQLASVTAFSNAAQKFNIMAWRTKYTKPGAKYKIRSKFNNVN